MQNFDFRLLEPFLYLLIGLIAVLLPIIRRNQSISLKDTGEKVEGIVYDLGRYPYRFSDFENSVSVKDKVTIRFLTKKDEWITSDLKQPFTLFFTGQYKQGDKVEVYYDPINPTNFYVDNK